MLAEGVKSFFNRVGDGLVTGLGVLIVGALGAFVWDAYRDAMGELKIATQALNDQVEINRGLVDQLKRVNVLETAVVALANQLGDRRNAGDRESWNLEFSDGFNWEAGEKTQRLDELIGRQVDLLSEDTM